MHHEFGMVTGCPRWIEVDFINEVQSERERETIVSK